MGRGPLTAPLKLPQFTVVAFMPISPVLSDPTNSNTTPNSGTPTSKGNARQGETGYSATGSAVDFISKLVILAALLAAMQLQSLPLLALEFLYAIGLYIFIALVMSCMGIAVVGILNLQIAPHFDRPFLSSSFTDFWSRRWNLNTGYTMRFCVYDPICEGRLVKKLDAGGPPGQRISFSRRAAAVCASFLVSGILHENFIIYLRGRVSGYWLAFFGLQGPIIIFESVTRRWLKSRNISISSFIAIPLTLGLMLMMGHMLFFPDIARMGIIDQVVGNLSELLAVGKGAAALH